MFQHHQGIGPRGITEQALLELALGLPSPIKGQRLRPFKKDCVEAGAHQETFLALVHQNAGGVFHLMKLLIHGRNLDVTPAIREYTETKLTRAINHFEGLVKEADVHLSVARNPRVPQQTVEVTVFANGTVIRAQEHSDNLYASIDLAASKLSRQLNKYHDRLKDHHHSAGHRASLTPGTDAVVAEEIVAESLTADKEPGLPSPGVRRKYFEMPAMELDQALHQLELIDHDFYVFRDAASGQIQVAYRRNHGGFGVIQSKQP
jgi:putative sigma-54 modulation protein